MSILKANGGMFNYIYLAIITVGILLTYYVYYLVDGTAKKNILNRSQVINAAISRDSVSNLSGGAQDISSSDYKNIKSYFQTVKKVNSDIKFISLIGFDGDGFYFYVDSENEGTADYSPPGQRYSEVPSEISGILQKRSGSAFYYSDRWGRFLGGYVPVLDSDGRVLAIVGIDVLAKDELFREISLSLIPLIISILVCLFIFSVSIYISNKNKRRDMMNKVDIVAKAEKEISAPLSYIKWEIDSLMQNEHVKGEIGGKLSEVYKQCLQVVGGVDSLLKVFLIHEGEKVLIKNERINIFQIIENAIRSNKIFADEKDLKIDIDESLSKKVQIISSQEHVLNIISKLLKNIISYTKISTIINISYAELDDHYAINFSDSGAMLDDKYVNFLLSPESQDAEYSELFAKNDLSVDFYIAKKTAEMIGGKLVYYNFNDKNNFSLYLPKK